MWYYIEKGWASLNLVKDKLHIEELKEYFSKNRSITFIDFKNFYKEIYPDISESTVRGNIYKLKKENVVRHVSRGQYSLTEKSKDTELK